MFELHGPTFFAKYMGQRLLTTPPFPIPLLHPLSNPTLLHAWVQVIESSFGTPFIFLQGAYRSPFWNAYKTAGMRPISETLILIVAIIQSFNIIEILLN